MSWSSAAGRPRPLPATRPFPQPRENVVERLVRNRRQRGQFAFAQEAKERLPAAPEVLLGKSHRGLHVIALGEWRLERPLALLRAAYGPALQIDRGQGAEPVVEARIGLETRYLDPVREALGSRGARPTEEYVGAHYCVLRFDAPASRLFGLPQEIDALTFRRATHQLIVSGYA